MMITPASMIPRYLAVGFLLATAAILSLSCSRKQSELTDSTNLEPESTNIEAKRMINIPLQDPREAVFMTAIGAINPEQALATSAAFAADKAGFFALLEQAEADSASAGDFLQLVDKTHGLAADYEPADLVSLNEYPLRVSRNDLRLRRAIIDAVLAMDQAARAEGISLVFSSAYRSYLYQEGLFARYANQYGEAQADRFSARPGHSQHQLGTVIDFGSIDDGFADTEAGKWVAANAWRFGFSLSYPQGMEDITGYIWESWHFRYLSQPGARLVQDYFGGIQQYFLEFLAEYRRSFTTTPAS